MYLGLFLNELLIIHSNRTYGVIHKPCEQFLDIFDPPLFGPIYKIRLMDIWQTPSPAKSIWFMNDPFGALGQGGRGYQKIALLNKLLFSI